MTTYPVDHNKIIFAGTTAGGRTVIDFAMQDVIPMTGLVLNCPVVSPNIKEKDIQLFFEHRKKIGIITGENDFALGHKKN